ncbi:MAG: recombinase family protein [Chloroflexota bacterium]
MPDYMPPPPELSPGSTVWVYLRDSGGSAQELSVKQQQDEVERFSAQYGLLIRHIFADVARTGTTTVGRDAFNDMIDMVEDAELRPDGLLLWNFARFAREMDDASFFKGLIRRNRIVIHSMTDQVAQGEFGRVHEVLIDYTNENKSRQTSRDVKRALRALVRQGFSCGGFPPRGYKAEPVVIGTKRDNSPRKVSRWVPDPNLWEAGKMAWRMRAQGKSYYEIQEATGCRLYRSKGSWVSFFQNKTYLGIGKCGMELFEDHHPAMVDRETWDKVQEIQQAHPRRGNSGGKRHPRRQVTVAMLTGLVVCIHCGSAMVSKRYTHSGTWRCYICNKKYLQGYDACEGRQVNARNAEVVVLDTLLNRILTPAYFNQLLARVQTRLDNDPDFDNRIALLRKSLADTERAIQNLLDMVETFGAHSAVDRLRQREAEKATLSAQLRNLESQLHARHLQLSPEALDEVFHAWREQMTDTLGRQDIQAARIMIERFIIKIELGYDQVRIRYRYPLEVGLGRQDEKTSLEAEPIERSLHDLDQKSIQSIYKLVPHLAKKPLPPRKPRPINLRDLEIYRLHTGEKKSIRQLAEQYRLSEIRVWNICTTIRKLNPSNLG